MIRVRTAVLISLGLIGPLLSAGCASSETVDPPPNSVTGRLTANGAPIQAVDYTGIVVAFAKMQGNQRPDDREVLDALGIPRGDDEFGAADDVRPPGAEPEEEAGDSAGLQVFDAHVNEDGTYVAHVPNGKFVIVVRHFPLGTLAIDGPVDTEDALNGRFSARRSPFIREISGDTEIDLEVGQKRK